MYTIRAKLKTMRNDGQGYLVYVFENVESNNPKYIMMVRFPNWESPFPRIGEVGFLKYKEVIAGEDKWWDPITNKYVVYNYDNFIFLDFIREQPEEQTVLL